MAAHTPGPWSVRPHEFDDWGFVRSSDGSLVACARAGHMAPTDYDACRRDGVDPYEHNARLIAAAPDLLAAARAALNDRMYKEWPQVADLLIAAIAKAEGR